MPGYRDALQRTILPLIANELLQRLHFDAEAEAAALIDSSAAAAAPATAAAAAAGDGSSSLDGSPLPARTAGPAASAGRPIGAAAAVGRGDAGAFGVSPAGVHNPFRARQSPRLPGGPGSLAAEDTSSDADGSGRQLTEAWSALARAGSPASHAKHPGGHLDSPSSHRGLERHSGSHASLRHPSGHYDTSPNMLALLRSRVPSSPGLDSLMRRSRDGSDAGGGGGGGFSRRGSDLQLMTAAILEGSVHGRSRMRRHVSSDTTQAMEQIKAARCGPVANLASVASVPATRLPSGACIYTGLWSCAVV